MQKLNIQFNVQLALYGNQLERRGSVVDSTSIWPTPSFGFDPQSSDQASYILG